MRSLTLAAGCAWCAACDLTSRSGFENGTEWINQTQTIIETVQNNTQAAWVIRAVSMGSEPLLDQVFNTTQELVDQMDQLKTALDPWGIPVSASDQAAYLLRAPDVLQASDIIEPHLQPQYSRTGPKNGSDAWPYVSNYLTKLRKAAGSKPIVAVQAGWQSNENEQMVAPGVNASIASEQGYFDVLAGHCQDWKVRAR